MVENKISEDKKALNLTPKQRNFVNAALRSMYRNLTDTAPGTDRYKDLEQNIYQLENLHEFNFEFGVKDGEIRRLDVTSVKENLNQK